MLTLFLFCFQATLLKCNHGCDRVGLVCSYQVSFHEQKTLILNSTPSSRPSLIVATILPNVERLELRVAFGCKCWIDSGGWRFAELLKSWTSLTCDPYGAGADRSMGSCQFCKRQQSNFVRSQADADSSVLDVGWLSVDDWDERTLRKGIALLPAAFLSRLLRCGPVQTGLLSDVCRKLDSANKLSRRWIDC